jgi:uncharacterized protein (TIGR02246 family)
MRSRIVAVLLLTACAGGPPAAGDTEADKAAIRAKLATVVAAHNAANAEAWANVAAEDIVLMVDGGPSINGRAAILEWIKGFYAANKVSDMKAEAVEIEIAGDWAYSRDHFSATLTPAAGGKPLRMDGKEIAIWRRQPDGAWHASRVIFNSNIPPTAP